jgi:hypothetical protein
MYHIRQETWVGSRVMGDLNSEILTSLFQGQEVGKIPVLNG